MIIFLTGSQLPIYGQNVIWLESVFDSPRLVKTSADGTELLSKFLPKGSLPQGIAVDAKRDALYFTGLGYLNAQVNTLFSDFESDSVVVDSQSVLRGIAIDTVNNQIYWTATNLITGPKILRANLDDLSPIVLIDFGPGSNNTPRSIDLDIAGGKMYWTNFGEGKIQRADLSVEAVPEDILLGLNGPSGLAVDADSGRVFWTEMNGHQIKSADLNGENETLIVSDLSYPNYLSVNRSINRMAWTEMGTGKVKSAALDGSDIFDYGITATAPTGIIIESSPVSSIGGEGVLQSPLTFTLQQNYPNPFNPETTIEYNLPSASDVKLEIFNISGQIVSDVEFDNQPAGYYNYIFKGDNLASGTYIYRLQARSFIQTRKMILLR